MSGGNLSGVYHFYTVGVLTPRSPEAPTLSGDTIGRQQADIYPYMNEPQTRQDDDPDRH